MPEICLNMIVRNEAPVISRCLASVKPFIDRWVIVDTGSIDGTQALVRKLMAGLPGDLFERPWVNFDHNRNEALDLARSHLADHPGPVFAFFIDADETLSLPDPSARPPLDADGYHIMCDYDGMAYARQALVNLRHPWRWEGVLHECLSCPQAAPSPLFEGARILVSHDGARARDPLTYQKDAALLEQALADEPGNTRYAFYLAQSLRDAGEHERSLAAYRRRAGMGGWEEERWYSLYQVAVLLERLEAPAPEVAWAYVQAHVARPTRAEPLVQLARFHRERGEHVLAMIYAREAARLPEPGDILFVEPGAYRWQALDEISVNAFYAGRHSEGADAVRRLQGLTGLPDDVRQRVLANAAFYA